ncbi:hypothetical protein LPJ53_000898 [Coemansia erecta]|uniref:Uncharacterized protein n=1 Tax=Coemansia erecta TaxID=147472 RepID=A0A9W8CSR0_9FUNG|nr:hypothetical protein LPJ53_000898 [Coemansia erecta]
MTTEPYAYNGSPPAPHGGSSVASDQYSGQYRYTTTAITAAAMTATTAAGPVNTGPAAASAALGYGALLHNQQQQQQQRRRRESNAPSDSTEPRHQQPQHASQQTTADGDETSEDEIESLKRAMGSDLWALQKQRMRREQMHRPPAAGENVLPPAAMQKDAPSVTFATPYAPTTAPTQRHYYPTYTQSQHQPPPQHQHQLSPPIPQLPEFAGQDWKYMDSGGPGSAPVRIGDGPILQSAFTSPAYVQQQQHQQQQQHAGGQRHYNSGGYVNGTAAADIRQAPQNVPNYDVQVFSAAESTAYTYVPVTSPQQQPTQLLYAQPHYPVQNNQYHHHHPQQYPRQHHHQQQQQYQPSYPHMIQQQQQQHWADSSSVQSNDQISGSVTDASGFSQNYRTQNANPFAAVEQRTQPQPQSPTLVQAHSPMMEQRHTAAQTAASTAAAIVAATVPLPAQSEHVTNAAYSDGHDSSGYHRAMQQQQQQNGMGTGAAPMQEMQEQRSSPGYEVQSAPLYDVNPLSSEMLQSAPLTTPAIPIQSLLNSPEQLESSSDAIHQHIVKENARFRQNSVASSHPPQMPSLPTASALPHPDLAQATQNSSPGSRSSYHSAGYSTWYGRAETVNQDFATAQQSFSSIDGTGLGVSVAPEAMFATSAPLPPIPASLAPAKASPATYKKRDNDFGFDYFSKGGSGTRHGSKPVSILVQVGDDSQEDEPPSRGHADTAAIGEENDESKPSDRVQQPGRKATTESLDNVLEYYRTQPDVLDKHSEWESSNDDRVSTDAALEPAAAVDTAVVASVNPFDQSSQPFRQQQQQQQQHLNERAELGSSRYPIRDPQLSPLYQRTSFSSPLVKPNDVPSRAQLTSATALPEPDDLMLPPTTVQTLQPTQKYGHIAELDVDNDPDVLQMESIDDFGELSDILDFTNIHNDLSDYDDYSTSNSSIDSFGEQIEHTAGILSKPLGESTNIAGVVGNGSASRLSAAPVVIHQLSTPIFGPENQPLRHQQQTMRAHPGALTTTAGYGEEQQSNKAKPVDGALPADTQPEDAAHDLAAIDGSGTSTFPASTAVPDSADVASTTATLTNTGTGTAVAATAAAAGSTAMTATATSGSTAGSAPVNNTPLEIMEHASELEISLAREQEDYYSDNVSQANLDPMILQNLGKSVHQQCLIQRQQIQRRKSNMQLGLPATAHSTHNGGNNSSSDEHGGSAGLADIQQYDDYEQALRAMLIEVSQYFAQSGLNLVFPLSAKWVDWLTRHPDRPFPWRKDPEEDAQNGGDDEDAGSQSSVSSFGEDPPMLSRPLPPEDVLSKATIPMSTRRPVPVKNFVSHEKRKGINAHWQYYSVINQITVVASNIHRMLTVPQALADHSFVPHQLAALYQFLGGDFKKYKPSIESVFEAVKISLGVSTRPSTPVAANGPTVNGAPKEGDDSTGGGGNSEQVASEPSHAGDADQAAEQQQQQQNLNRSPAPPKLLDATYVHVLRDMMANIITEALYSTSKVALNKENPMPSSPTGTRAKTDQPAQEAVYAISTLKGLPTQSIVRYLAKEMRTANGDRRRRGFAHNLSRNNSIGHLRPHHHQYPFQQQQQPPVPPLPNHPQQQQHGQNNGVASNNDGSSDHPKIGRGSYTRQTPAPKHAVAAAHDHGTIATAATAGQNTTATAILHPILSGDEEHEQYQA